MALYFVCECEFFFFFFFEEVIIILVLIVNIGSFFFTKIMLVRVKAVKKYAIINSLLSSTVL